MDNWLLIIVGVIFLISIVAGYVRGLLKIGISLLATVLSIVLVMFLAPYVSDALIKWTPADEMIEEKCMEMFMPQISADTLKKCRFKRDFTWGIESGSAGGYQQSGLEPVGDQHSGYFEYHRRDPKRSADSGD